MDALIRVRWQRFGANNFAASLIILHLLTAVAFGENAKPPPLGMVEIPTGVYEPLYSGSDLDLANDSDGDIVVERFLLDERAVTNSDYLEFVTHTPKWQKSRVPGLFADASYLQHWSDDLDYGSEKNANLPVVNVSWFAAMAYCRAKSKQLPTVAQWERAAGASETMDDARKDVEFSQRILDWYASPADQPLDERLKSAHYQNLYGAWDMHGLIWEWTRDFNTAMVTGESRGDSGLQRQLFCGSGSIGAADPRNYTAFMRFAFRSSLEGSYTVGSLGFRCSASTQ